MKPPFQPSDKIVRVEPFKTPRSQFEELCADMPELDKIYVVRECVLMPPLAGDSGWSVRLVGVCAGFTLDGTERAYAAERFRKLDDIKAENQRIAQQKKLAEMNGLHRLLHDIGY